jgi:hypothetical protein
LIRGFWSVFVPMTRVTSLDAGYRKPHPRVFEVALAALGVGLRRESTDLVLDASRRGAALANLANAETDMQKYDEARSHNNAALILKTASKDAVGMQRSRILDARIDRETKNLDRAKRQLESVIAGAPMFLQ